MMISVLTKRKSEAIYKNSFIFLMKLRYIFSGLFDAYEVQSIYVKQKCFVKL